MTTTPDQSDPATRLHKSMAQADQALGMQREWTYTDSAIQALDDGQVDRAAVYAALAQADATNRLADLLGLVTREGPSAAPHQGFLRVAT